MLRSHSSKGVQTMHWAGAVPVHWQKGRGAVANPQGRFELQRREREPQSDQLAATAPLQTPVQIEIAKSIIARNQSPDIFFDQSINPYRGCEHGCIYCYARPNHSLIGLSQGRILSPSCLPRPTRRRCCAPSWRRRTTNAVQSTLVQ